MVRGAKKIAEYAIRRWLYDHEFVMECFSLTMMDDRGVLKDSNNDTLTLVYDSEEKRVYVEDQD